MKAFNTIVKILTALAAVAGAVYVAATYGDQIVAWCKKVLASLPKCPCCEPCCEAEEFAEEEPIPETPVEEAAEEAEEVPAEEPVEDETVEEIPMAPLAENEPVADEQDFAE